MKAALIKCWRVLRWLLLAALLLALTLIATLWWANRHDDPLRPEVAALLKFEPPSPEAMRGNGYFTMLGLGAPAGEDAFEAGQRCFAVQMRVYAQFQQTGKWNFSSDAACQGASVLLAPIVRCDAEVRNCAAHYVQHAAAIRQASDKHAALMQRYRLMVELAEYVEVIPPNHGNLPYYLNVVTASELWDMQATLALAAGETTHALQLLTQNAQLHQRMMRGARTLVGAMIALALDMRHQRVMSSLVHQWPQLAQGHLTDLEIGLGRDDANLFPALEGERQFSLRIIAALNAAELLNEPGLVSRIMYYASLPIVRVSFLPNATLNQGYQHWQAIVELAQLPAEQFGPRAAAVSETERQAVEGQGILPFRLRNFWGNVLLGFSTPSTYVTYIERTYDVEAHRRLVLLQIKALQERVPLAQMPTWLAARPPELRNPYTLQPMGWDAATQALVFEGRQPNTQNPEPRNVFRVPIGPVEAGAIANQRQ